MFILNLIFLFASVFPTDWLLGETKWVTLPISESYEYQIMDGKGALSVKEHQKYFRDQGFRIEHQEIKRSMIVFDDLFALKQWVRFELAPQVGMSGDEHFVEEYVAEMQRRGWLQWGDGKIRFPRKELLVLLKADSIAD